MKEYDTNEFSTNEDTSDYLGIGSFATARRCHHKKLDNVVVKCFDLKKIKDKQRQNIQQEAEILYTINHVNIVKVFGVTRWEHGYGIVMEEADGSSLEDLLFSDINKIIPWKLRLRISSQIADAINYLHHHDPYKSYVHGDLKPQNILLTKDLVVKVADFGAASLIQNTESSGNSLIQNNQSQYTDFYIAPEYFSDDSKISGKKTLAMDVYSFAMILYEIITRQEVYRNSQCRVDLILYKIINDGLKPDEELVKIVGGGLKNADREIFEILQKFMRQGWETISEKRPSIAETKISFNNCKEIDDLKKEASSKDGKRVLLSKLKPPFKMAAERRNECHNFLCRPPFKTAVRMFEKFTKPLLKTCLLQSNRIKGAFLALEGKKAWIFDLSSFKATELPELQHEHSCPSMVNWNNQVFVISGWKTQSVERLDVNEQSAWHEIDPINRNRWFGAATVTPAGKMFVSGGFWDMASVESYDMRSEKPDWEISMKPMNWSRSSHALVYLDGYIYAIGGVGLNTAERCNPEVGVWEDLDSMKYDRNGLAAVVLNDQIYAIGGKSDNGVVAMIEKFDPKNGKWSDVTCLKVPRCKHGACVIDGRIFIVGGDTDLVEMYDPKDNACHDVKKFKHFKQVRAVIDV